MTCSVPVYPPQPEAAGEIHRSSSMSADQADMAVEPAPSRAPDTEAKGETMAAQIERLGRERPENFKTLWSELGFCFSIVMSQILTEYFVSGFTVVIPTLAHDLAIPRSSTTWPASAFSLVVSAFLLPFGRLADMYGGRTVYIAGTAWLTVLSIVAGFSQNAYMMIFCRALQGLGPSAFLPTSLMLLGSCYRPGPRKNLVFSIYGACAPLGFFIGIFFAGVAAQYTSWGWYFWIGAILCALTTVVAWVTIPSDVDERKAMGVQMDWLGSALIVSGLILVVFAITDSAHAPSGWATPYIYVCFVAGVLLLGAAVYVEGWLAAMPLLPFSLFKIKYMSPLIIALLFFYGGLGLFLLYATFYMQNIMGATPLQLVAWYTPCALGGCIIATVGGFVLHLIPGTAMIIFAGVAWIIAPLLFALAPPGANYWAYVFPSMICTTVGIDISFNITNIFITTSMPTRQQGLAGGLINSVLQLGIALFLGAADIIATKTGDGSERQGYKNAFWFGVAIASFSLVILMAFVKIDKAKSDFSADEKEAQAALEAEKVADGEKAT